MTRRAQSALPSGKAKAPTCCAAARILATLAAVLQPVLENRGRPAPSKSERMGRARVPVSPKAVRAGPEVDCRRRNRNGEGAHASRWVGARRGGSGRLKRVAASRRAERSEAEEVWRMVSRLSSATSELNESAIPVEKELGREFMPRSQWTRGRGRQGRWSRSDVCQRVVVGGRARLRNSMMRVCCRSLTSGSLIMCVPSIGSSS